MTTVFRIGPVFLNINELDQFLTMLNPVRIFMIFFVIRTEIRTRPIFHGLRTDPDQNPDHGVNHKMSDQKIGFLK